jgi:hypothetical protein
MLKTELGKFDEFVGAGVSELKVNFNMETEWFWLTGNCNPANLGMRTDATPRDFIAGSEYQESIRWMKRPHWPYKRTCGQAPWKRSEEHSGCCSPHFCFRKTELALGR